MANYYFLATLLPPLKVGAPVELNSKELEFLLQQNLTKEDYESVAALNRFIDIENIRAVLKKQPIMPGGTLDQYDLEDSVAFKEGLPQYVLDYLEEGADKQELLDNFARLLHRYFAEESKSKSSFVANYITFEWHLKLVLVAIRAHELGRNLEEELKDEDQEDPFVTELLERSKDKHFELPAPYQEIKALYDAKKDQPLDLYQTLSEWRFSHIEELIEWEFFSIERILGYVAELKICEEWLQLDKLKGLEIVDQMMDVV